MLTTMINGLFRKLQRGGTQLNKLALVLMVVCWPALASAQSVAKPPSPHLNRVPQVWVGLLVMFVLLVLVIGVSLMPSKRSHQD
jgi:hypothetical protein